MSISTAADRSVAELWWGSDSTSAINEEGTAISDPEVQERDEEIPLRGGNLLSENHDHFYQKHVIASQYEDSTENDKLSMLKIMKGLHRHPQIPVTCSYGIASVDLQAASSFLSQAFDLECEIVPLSDENVKSPFHFEAADDDDLEESINCLIGSLNSLTNFSQHHISLRHPLIPLSRPLPSFDVLAVPSSEGISEGISGSSREVGGGGGGDGGGTAASLLDLERSESLNKLFECFICFQAMYDPATLPCGHSACLSCLKESFSKKFHICPECRLPLKKEDETRLRVNITLRDAINKLYPDAIEARRQAIEASASASSSSSALMLKGASRLVPGQQSAWAFAADSSPSRDDLQAVMAWLNQSVAELDVESLRDPRELQKVRVREKMCEDANSLRQEGGDSVVVLHNSIRDFMSRHFLRILRRAGAVGDYNSISQELRDITGMFLEDMIRNAVAHSETFLKKVVTADDVLSARPQGKRLLGFGGPFGIRHMWSTMICKVLKQVHPYTGIDHKALSVLNDANSVMLVELLNRAKEMACGSALYRERPNAEDEKDDDSQAFGYKVVCAGPDSEPTSFTTKVYNAKYDDSGEFTAVEDPGPIIRYRFIENAVRMWFPGELAKHAVSEGTKAVTKFTSGVGYGFPSPDDYVGRGPGRPFVSAESRAGLQNSPSNVALIASRVTGGFPMTEAAAVYLAAVLEYITAEVLELSGNAARDNSKKLINCRHIHLAVLNDEELDTVFRDCEIRQGGVLPNIHKALSKKISAERSQDVHADVSFAKIMINKARAAATASGAECTVFIDPRTGFHMGVYENEDVDEDNEDDEDEDEEHSSRWYARRLPELDAISTQGQQARRKLAESALSEAEVAIMKAEGYCILENVERDPSWSLEPLHKMHERHLREIRQEQRSGDYIFPPLVFQRVVREISQSFRSQFDYTQEAMEAMQAYTENYLVGLCEDALLVALEHGQALIQPRHLQLSRRLRGERR